MIVLPASLGLNGPATGAGATLWSLSNLANGPGFWMRDDSPVTAESGSEISQWNDISGGGLHFSIGTASRHPTVVAAELNGRRVTRFDGLNDGLANNSDAGRDLFRAKSNGWIVSVYRCRSAGGTNAEFVFNASVGTSSVARLSLVSTISGAQTRPRLGARRYDGDSFSSLPAGSSFGTDWLIVLALMNWSSGVGTIWVNGTENVSTSLTSSGSTSDTRSNDPLAIGTNSDLSNLGNCADIDVAEVSGGASGLPDSTEIDKIFGYAGHRWGLAGVLPGGHPYKESPPEV